MAETAEKREVVKAELGPTIEKLERKFGKGCIGKASAAKALGSFRRIETGIFAIDSVTGGGIPYGQASLFYGVESGGKSCLALKTVAAIQRMCRDHAVKMVPTGKKLNRCANCGHRGPEEACPNKPCKGAVMEAGAADDLACPECKKHKPHRTLYMDSEGCFTTAWAAKMGVDCDLVYVAQPETAEEAMDSSMLLLETGEFEMVVVDTLAQLVPSGELESSAFDWQQALQAKLVNKALRAWQSVINAAGVDKMKRLTFLFLNQVRFKIVKFGDPTTKPGGKGQDYAAVLELKMWGGKYELDDLGNTLGVVVCAHVQKNKTSPTVRQEANFRLWLRDCEYDGEQKKAGDTDEEIVLLDYGLKFKVLVYDGKTYSVDGYETVEKLTSRAALLQILRTDPEIRKHVRRCLMGKMIGEVWFSLDEQEKARKKQAREGR